MSIHFLIKSFLKNDPFLLDPYNIDEKNHQANIRLDEDVLKFVVAFRRRLVQNEYINLSHASSRRLQDDLIKTNIFVLVIRPQDVFKASCEDIFKTSSRRFQDVSSRCCYLSK